MLSVRCLTCPVLSVTFVHCGQMVGRIKMKLGMQVARPRPWPHCVRWGRSSLPKNGAEPPPPFLAHVYCGQTAGWMNLVLGMEVGLSPGDFLLDGDLAPLLQKGAEPPPQFSAHICCGQTAGCILMPLGMEVGLGLCDATLCSMWTQLPPEKRAHPLPPYFWPMPIVAKWLDG